MKSNGIQAVPSTNTGSVGNTHIPLRSMNAVTAVVEART